MPSKRLYAARPPLSEKTFVSAGWTNATPLEHLHAGDAPTSKVIADAMRETGRTFKALRSKLTRLQDQGVITPRGYKALTGGAPEKVWPLSETLAALSD